MSFNNFIPMVWSVKIAEFLAKALVYGGVANRDYEGEISEMGDTVKVNEVGDITIGNYVKNTTSISFQELMDAGRILEIDQSKYFAFKIDDIDKAQAKGELMTKAQVKAVYAMADNQDQYLAGLYAQAGITGAAIGTDASPIDVNSANVEATFLEAGRLMDEANLPQEGRFAIIPPWVKQKLILAGITTLTDNVALWTNGNIGRALGFNMKLSNNVSKNSSAWDKTRVMCGIDGESWALANQIKQVEALRPESSFSDAIKGLWLYGGKVMRPDKMATIYMDLTAEA